MPYTVTSFDGNFTIDAVTLNTTSTALALSGKNYAGWGEPYANNFTHLLENFAGDTAPSKKRTGQVWYDTANKILKVWDTRDTAWAAVGETAARLTTPVNISLSGDATGTVSFDGSADVTIDVSLVSTLVPGQFNTPSITVDSFGRITSITNSGGDGAGPAQYVESFTGATTRSGAITLNAADVRAALGFTPADANTVPSALTFTPAHDNLVVHKSGDTMTGPLTMSASINMVNNTITGVPNPITGDNPVNLTYLNSRLASVPIHSVTVSPYAPSGGSDGDVWYRY